MGFIDKLWDETVAGPTPECGGLGKLRKQISLSHHHHCIGIKPLSSSPPIIAAASPAMDDQAPRISRSISILRRSNSASPNWLVCSSPDSTGSSPPSPATPTSPFSPTTPRGNHKLARRKSTPSGYDWIVLSALDR
ncbi:unnamed protein product [Cuscuta epithymum]|uniref:Uncharacterized protein n=1 Tax=Cuscuta epithymum TaxID=186058 RepID=A0AAV0C381_9ASTE|nr:unnamed protein product [Cuscuta epithymum]